VDREDAAEPGSTPERRSGGAGGVRPGPFGVI